MNEMKVDWSDLNLFLAVARGGGLAGGAEICGMSPPSLGRHMVVLERALGEVLFARLPRGYELTDAGMALFSEAQSVEEEILGIQRRRSGHGTELPINVTAGTWMTRFLATHINDISIPGAQLVFRNTESRDHIGRRESTIGIRNARPQEPGLAGRKVARPAFAPYAAAAATATATVTAARQSENWIATTAQTPSANWVRIHKSNDISLQVTDPRTLLDLARQGAGRVVLPCFVGDCDQMLARTGPIIPELSHDQWLVVHDEERNQPLVRQTVDLIAELIVSNRDRFVGQLPQKLSNSY